MTATVQRHPCGCFIQDGREPCEHFDRGAVAGRVVAGEYWEAENAKWLAVEAEREKTKKCAACDGTGKVGEVVCRLCKRPDPKGPSAT